ncbi:NAD-dependent epimerase/dehydratase family protein [Ilumatobacter nonamiensis]|uniref:NAD-dependent epimerase/dehydratase family protein n=1 Tax=Ilumatobacter nonamiensis TaxID=467093 RepID=UPI00034971D5|nr:SDR family oxidoreductase [Ilumatobacter nonamiensis]
MKVLVTGAAGYVGASVVPELLSRPWVDEVVLYDNLARREYSIFSAGIADGRAEFVLGDILDGRRLSRALEGVDAVIHMAAAVHAPRADSDAHFFDQVNNWGSGQVAQAVETSDSVTRLIYLSSVAVYGGGGSVHSTDATPRPNTFYGVTKLRGEGHFTRLRTKSRTVHIVRAGNVFGFNRAARFDGMINKLALDAKINRRIRIEGSGEQTRSVIEVDRLATALVSLLGEERESELFNFVDDVVSVVEVAELLREACPGMETLFVDQDMAMPSLTARRSAAMRELVGAGADPVKTSIDRLLDALHL